MSTPTVAPKDSQPVTQWFSDIHEGVKKSYYVNVALLGLGAVALIAATFKLYASYQMLAAATLLAAAYCIIRILEKVSNFSFYLQIAKIVQNTAALFPNTVAGHNEGFAEKIKREKEKFEKRQNGEKSEDSSRPSGAGFLGNVMGIAQGFQGLMGDPIPSHRYPHYAPGPSFFPSHSSGPLPYFPSHGSGPFPVEFSSSFPTHSGAGTHPFASSSSTFLDLGNSSGNYGQTEWSLEPRSRAERVSGEDQEAF